MNQNSIEIFQLRPYQKQLMEAVETYFQGCRRLMLQLATGGGKTVLFAAIAQEFRQRQQRVLVMAHREELILQAKAKLEVVTSTPVGVIKAGYPRDYGAEIQVASVQSLGRRIEQVGEFGLVIIDEAHHCPSATYQHLLKSCAKAYHLGVTATPCRQDGLGFEDLFEALVCGPSVADLISQGYLSQYRLFGAERPMKTQGSRSQGGDYLGADIAKLNNVVELSGDLVRAYQDHGQGKRCLVFAINVNHSQGIAERYNQVGIRAAHLDGDSPREIRQRVLAEFAAGNIKVICNCGLFSEGLDIPALEVVQLARPTQSLGLYLQMVGRVLRPAPGKDHAIIIDHTRNYQEHGLPHEPREWTLAMKPKKEGMIPALSRGGYEPKMIDERTSRLLKEIQVNLRDGTSAQIMQALIREQQDLGYQRSWLGYRAKEKGLPLQVLRAVADYLGYKPSWVYH